MFYKKFDLSYINIHRMKNVKNMLENYIRKKLGLNSSKQTEQNVQN